MVTLSLDMGFVNAAIQILKLPVLILGVIILFRINRILTHTERSVESIERTAENVERSSRTFGGLLNIFRSDRSDENE